jgi:hypothetical protein
MILRLAGAPLLRAAPSALAIRARGLCAEADTALSNAYFLLGLKPGAPKRAVKLAYYALAKETHPDAVGPAAAPKPGPAIKDFSTSSTGILAADTAADRHVDKFLEVQSAFELLIEELEGGGASKAGGAKRPRARRTRPKTLGEVLCDRLRDEPEAVAEVWEELKQGRLDVTAVMADEILKAHAKRGGGGLAAAMHVLYEATHTGMLQQQARRSSRPGFPAAPAPHVVSSLRRRARVPSARCSGCAWSTTGTSTWCLTRCRTRTASHPT